MREMICGPCAVSVDRRMAKHSGDDRMRWAKTGLCNQLWLGLATLVVAVGVAGCSCHKSTCYDGDCGLVYDDDYFGPDCGGGHSGGCGVPSGHAAGCGGCGAPAAAHGCSHPYIHSSGCGVPHGPACSSCGGVHHEPAPPAPPAPPGCPHCGQQHGPPAAGAPPADPMPMKTAPATSKDPPPPPLPPAVPTAPKKKKIPVPSEPGAGSTATTSAAGVEPAPPTEPVEVPLPVLEKPPPIPRDASNPKRGLPVPEPLRWIPRRI